jgi:aspartate kinase
VPVRILNSHRPDVPGSLITAGPTGRAGPLAALACKRGVTMVDITSNRMLMAHGFLHRLFEVFERFETSIDVVTTSEVSVSVTLDERTRLTEIVQALEVFADVTSESGVAIICLVGEGLRDDPALAGAVLGALDGLAVRMVSQAAARRNLTVVLRDVDLPSAMVRLHDHFFERGPAAARADGAIGPPTDKAAGPHGVLP